MFFDRAWNVGLVLFAHKILYRDQLEWSRNRGQAAKGGVDEAGWGGGSRPFRTTRPLQHAPKLASFAPPLAFGFLRLRLSSQLAPPLKIAVRPPARECGKIMSGRKGGGLRVPFLRRQEVPMPIALEP